MTHAPLRPETRSLIHGPLAHGSNRGSSEKFDPATERVLGKGRSGGGREHGLFGFKEYLETKVIVRGDSPESVAAKEIER